MTTLLKTVANKLSFAHLASLGRVKPAAAPAAEAPDDDKDKAAAAEAPDDDKDDKDDKDKAKGGAAAPSAEDDKPPEGDGDEDDKDEKSKAAHAAGYTAGYQAQRDRCAAIFATSAAAQNIELAAELAFNSDMDVEAVGRALSKAPAPFAATRAARNPNVGPGHATSPSETSRAAAQQVDASWDAVMSRASGRAQKR